MTGCEVEAAHILPFGAGGGPLAICVPAAGATSARPVFDFWQAAPYATARPWPGFEPTAPLAAVLRHSRAVRDRPAKKPPGLMCAGAGQRFFSPGMVKNLSGSSSDLHKERSLRNRAAESTLRL